jgi:hypothetical protein
MIYITPTLPEILVLNQTHKKRGPKTPLVHVPCFDRGTNFYHVTAPDDANTQIFSCGPLKGMLANGFIY